MNFSVLLVTLNLAIFITTKMKKVRILNLIFECGLARVISKPTQKLQKLLLFSNKSSDINTTIAIDHIVTKSLLPLNYNMNRNNIPVCNFQSMKSPMELNSFFLELFCYIICSDEMRNWMPCKRGLYVKRYCFFEIIA